MPDGNLKFKPPMTPDQKDKTNQIQRVHPRYPVLLEVDLSGLSVTTRSARITDISLGGCYITTILSVEPGEKLQLAIKTPTGNYFKINATVVFRDQNIGFGVKFYLHENQEQFLQALIEYARQDI